jgi:SAM-dependent methyltransferase
MTDSSYALRLSDAELARYQMMATVARQKERDLWQAAGLVSGASVADVGCGPGAMFPALVDAVGAAGRVFGVDGDSSAVAAAQALVAQEGWSNVDVRQARADATGLTPGSVDAVMMRHVLAHNGPTEAAIVSHLATLVRPGGCVYLVDVEASAIRIRPSDPEVEELNDTYRRFHAARGNDLVTGLRLGELLAGAGLEVLDHQGWYNIISAEGGMRPPAWAARDAMVAGGFASEEDVQRWDAALERLTTQRPTLFAPVFGAVGRRPA